MDGEKDQLARDDLESAMDGVTQVLHRIAGLHLPWRLPRHLDHRALDDIAQFDAVMEVARKLVASLEGGEGADDFHVGRAGKVDAAPLLALRQVLRLRRYRHDKRERRCG